jgi:hypothetical protein
LGEIAKKDKAMTMRDFEVAFVIDNRATGPFVIYRARRRRVLAKAVMRQDTRSTLAARASAASRDAPPRSRRRDEVLSKMGA